MDYEGSLWYSPHFFACFFFKVYKLISFLKAHKPEPIKQPQKKSMSTPYFLMAAFITHWII